MKHRRPRYSDAKVLDYGRTLISDQDFNEILDALAVDALRALAAVEGDADPMPQLHMIFKSDDGQLVHQHSTIPIPDVHLKYEFFAHVGHTLGGAADKRLAAAYLVSSVWLSSTPGALPQDAADRQEAMCVFGLAFDCLRHNLYTANFTRNEAGKPRVTSEKTLHHGETLGVARWTANKLLLSLVSGFAKGVLDQVASSKTVH